MPNKINCDRIDRIDRTKDYLSGRWRATVYAAVTGLTGLTGLFFTFSYILIYFILKIKIKILKFKEKAGDASSR